MANPRVAILTDLTDVDRAYSIAGISLDHARILRRKGYEYTFFVNKNFNTDHAKALMEEGINFQSVLPLVHTHDYALHEGPKPNWAENVGKIQGCLKEILGDFDVVITHDLMFQSWHLPHNQAIRNVSEDYPRLGWVHWMHSGASGRIPYARDRMNAQPGEIGYPSELRYSAHPNGYYVCMNNTRLQHYINMINSDMQHVYAIVNPRDPRALFNMLPETWELADDTGLLDHDLVQTYAFSGPRWQSKGVDRLLALFGALKKHCGVDVCLILVIAHSTQKCDEKHLEDIETIARDVGLTPGRDVILTPRWSKTKVEKYERLKEMETAAKFARWSYAVPGDIVRDLFLLSDVFVFPSVSEGCSLIQAEAALCGCYPVLNRDFDAMFEFAPTFVQKFDFTARPYNGSADSKEYYRLASMELWRDISRDPILSNRRMARRIYNWDSIWRDLESLLVKAYREGQRRAG